MICAAAQNEMRNFASRLTAFRANWRFLSIVLVCFVSGALSNHAVANSLQVGDELAGDAVVSWDAVIDKVSNTGGHGRRIKAKLVFRGRTSEGAQIRGAGKMRFIAPLNTDFAVGDTLKGNDSMKYWASVRSIMGGDLAMIKGIAIFDLLTTESILTAEGVIAFDAALEIGDSD